MSSFRHVALVQSHQLLAPVHAYYLNDLVEICGLASFIRGDVEHVHIPVSPSDRDPLGAFERYMRRNRPDLVGLSVFTCGANSGREYARIASSFGAYVVAGGFHPSARPEEVLGWPGVEAVVRGEGEHALRDLVRSGSPRGIAGMSYRDGERFVHHDVPLPIADLDSLPMPARELRPERFGLRGLDYHTDTLYASRGCRGRCRFCANDLIGRNWRARSNELILRELLTLTPPRKGPWKYVKFWDSNFLADAERIEDLCHRILDHKLERWFRFIVESRVEDIVRAEPILKTMRKAGFVRIGCGVESPNRSTHSTMKKGINLDYVAKAAKLVADSEMQFTKFLIVGHPNESREDILAYPEYAASHGTRLQKTTVFVMTPYPGTELGDEYAANGQVTSFDWDLYNNQGAVVAPGDLSALELQALYFAVSASNAMTVRVRKGKSLLQTVVRMFEPLFIAVKMARLRDRCSREDLVRELMRALAILPVPAECARPSRGRSGLAVRFHADSDASVVIGIVAEGEMERLVVGSDGAPLVSRGRALREIHVSLPLLVALIERLDHKQLSHDVTLLRWKPAAYRLRWLPSLARQVALAAFGCARLVAFHCSRALFAGRARSVVVPQ